MAERSLKTSGAAPPSSITLMDKVSFLSLPENLHDCAKHVEVLQTHHSWLFITARHVFKLKKPLHDDRIDYRTLERRRWACREELRLNRRLAPRTYSRTIPIYQTGDGELSLVDTGTVVEWLVKMRRLPDDRMLDALTVRGALGYGEIERVMRRLTDFYRRAAAVDIPEASYCHRLSECIESIDREIQTTELSFLQDTVQETVPGLLRFIDLHSDFLESRFNDGYVRELHGDLRPEHICVDTEIEIFDCLEFDAELRKLDCLEEISFLGFGCARLDASWLELDIRTRYAQLLPDETYRTELADFYATKQALGRALLYARRVIARPTDGRCRTASEQCCQLAHGYCSNLAMTV